MKTADDRDLLIGNYILALNRETTMIGATATIQIGRDPVAVVCDEADVAILPDLSGNDWRDGAVEIADNEVQSCYAFDLANGLRLYVACDQGQPGSAIVSNEDMADHLLSWSFDCDSAEWLSSFDFDGLSVLTTADEGREVACRVWRRPHYYQGTCNAPQAGFARDADGNVLTFDNYAQAKEYVDGYYNEPSGYDGIPQCNVLSHGQAGADTLTIVEA